MITTDGWLDYAERMPASWNKTNPGVNPARGIFLHSAEGYADALLNLAVNGPLSWHLSNLMDGRLVQHYPFTRRCWHAGSGPNQSYIGMENEGVHTVETSLNEAQIDNAQRVIKDLADWKGWTPSRGGVEQTLWEHNEAPLIGGLPSACPSGRIPWDTILAGLNTQMVAGIGIHYTDGTDEEIWAPNGKTPDGIGVRYSDGRIEKVWPL